MPEATPVAVRRLTARRVATTTIAIAALAGGLLTAQSASAVIAPTSIAPSLASFSTWNQYGHSGSDFDYALAVGPHGGAALRISNAIPTDSYGVITQLSSPSIAEVGEPGTGAAYRVFTADFTIDAESYDAQPGLAVEVSADKLGSRGGGDLVFRQDTDGKLTISNYYLPEGSIDEDDATWRNKSTTVDFTGPVKVRYIVEFKSGAPDVVRVYVGGNLVIADGGTFEYYYNVISDPAQVVDSLQFRTSKNSPVVGGSWTRTEPTTGEKLDIANKGLYFSGIEYGASNTVSAPSSTSTIQVSASLSGTVVVGGTLTAAVTTSAISPTISYQWQREGLAIAGAPNSASYLISPNDVNKRLSVRVTASKTGSTSGTFTTPKTSAVTAATLVLPVPTITGTAKLGSTLTANGASTPAGTYAYQWFRNGVAIKGAVAKTYKPAAADVGLPLTVRLTASKAGYATIAATSAPTSSVAPGTLVAGTVTLGGTFKVGGFIAAIPTAWTSGATLKFAFYADGELVQFGVARLLKLTWEEQGKTMSVIVTGSKPGYDRLESGEYVAPGPVRA